MKTRNILISRYINTKFTFFYMNKTIMNNNIRIIITFNKSSIYIKSNIVFNYLSKFITYFIKFIINSFTTLFFNKRNYIRNRRTICSFTVKSKTLSISKVNIISSTIILTKCYTIK